MKRGTLYGIGIGPGDPELITVKGAAILNACRHVVVPKASETADSVALNIVRTYLAKDAVVHECVFPMSRDRHVLQTRWRKAALLVAELTADGHDVAFVTLGDPLLYSTYIYLFKAVREIVPELNVVTVPGVSAFNAVAAAAHFPVGRGKEPVHIFPAADNPQALQSAVNASGTVVLMKIGKRLPQVLESVAVADRPVEAVFGAHVGMENEYVEHDLERLRQAAADVGYLSTMILHAKPREKKS
ncbi:precorrin-2 C(20)-methyltransferase [Thermostilla marina]